MAQSPLRPERNDKAEDSPVPEAESAGQTGMERFMALAKKLLSVSREEIKERQEGKDCSD